MASSDLARRVDTLPGRAGVLVESLDGEVLFERAADEPFNSASVIKVPLVMALYAEAARGAIDLGARVSVGERVEGSGVLRHVPDVRELTVRDLAVLALTVSDNTATNRLIERLDTDVVNAYLDGWGCRRTRLRRKMYDYAARDRGLENEMTPREAVRLLRLLVRGELVDRATSDAVLAMLAADQDGTRLRRYLPEGVWVANKWGSNEGVRNDVGVIRVRRDILVGAFTRDLANELDGDELLAAVGWAAYRWAGGDAEAPAALV